MKGFKKGFINKEVAEVTGLNPKTIGYYSNTGFIVPGVSKGTGKGSNRVYSRADILKLMLIKPLSEHGLSIKKMDQLFKKLTKDLFASSLPWLNHGLPANRAMLGIYDLGKDDFTCRVVFPSDPAASEGDVRKKLEKNLTEFAVDLLNHGSLTVIDITDFIRRIPAD